MRSNLDLLTLTLTLTKSVEMEDQESFIEGQQDVTPQVHRHRLRSFWDLELRPWPVKGAKTVKLVLEEKETKEEVAKTQLDRRKKKKKKEEEVVRDIEAAIKRKKQKIEQKSVDVTVKNEAYPEQEDDYADNNYGDEDFYDDDDYDPERHLTIRFGEGEVTKFEIDDDDDDDYQYGDAVEVKLDVNEDKILGNPNEEETDNLDFGDEDDVKYDYEEEETKRKSKKKIKKKRGRKGHQSQSFWFLGGDVVRPTLPSEVPPPDPAIRLSSDASELDLMKIDDYVVARGAKDADFRLFDEHKEEIVGKYGDVRPETKNMYGCPFCGYRHTKQMWMRHLKREHVEEKQLIFCKRKMCLTPFQSEAMRDRHEKEAHLDVELDFTDDKFCHLCQMTFDSSEDLTEHMTAVHLDVSVFILATKSQ